MNNVIVYLIILDHVMKMDNAVVKPVPILLFVFLQRNAYLIIQDLALETKIVVQRIAHIHLFVYHNIISHSKGILLKNENVIHIMHFSYISHNKLYSSYHYSSPALHPSVFMTQKNLNTFVTNMSTKAIPKITL